MNEHVPYEIEYRCYTKQRRAAVVRRTRRLDSRRTQSGHPAKWFIHRYHRAQTGEEELAQKEGLLRTVMDSTSAVVYIKALDGKYLYINHEFEKLFNIHGKSTLDGRTSTYSHTTSPKRFARTINKWPKRPSPSV